VEIETDSEGRKIVLTTPNPLVAFHAANMFQQIDLGVSLRLGSDMFREEIVGVIISWFNDMCNTKIGGDGDIFRRLLAHALQGPRIGRPSGLGTGLTRDIYMLATGDEDVKRIDWMMQLDTRLWKKAKWELRQIYSDICNLDWDVRKEVGKLIWHRPCAYALTLSREIWLQLPPHVRTLPLSRSRHRHESRLQHGVRCIR